MVRVNHDLTKVLTPKYANKWVAMNPEQTRVVAVGGTPKAALEGAQKKGYKKPVMTFVVEDYSNLFS